MVGLVRITLRLLADILQLAVWVANSQSSGDRGMKQAAAVLLPSVVSERGRSS